MHGSAISTYHFVGWVVGWLSVVKFDAVLDFDSRLRACRIAGRESQPEEQ